MKKLYIVVSFDLIMEEMSLCHCLGYIEEGELIEKCFRTLGLSSTASRFCNVALLQPGYCQSCKAIIDFRLSSYFFSIGSLVEKSKYGC